MKNNAHDLAAYVYACVFKVEEWELDVPRQE